MYNLICFLYGGVIQSKLRNWNLFQSNDKGKRSPACIYVTPNLQCSLVLEFSDEDIVAVIVENMYLPGDHCVFV